MHQHKYLVAWVVISADVIFWSASLTYSQSIYGENLPVQDLKQGCWAWGGWRAKQGVETLLWPKCPRLVAESLIQAARSQPVLCFRVWRVEAAALKLFKVLNLSLKICLCIQALKSCSLSLRLSPVSVHPTRLSSYLCDLPMGNSELESQQCLLLEDLNENQKIFTCDFCLWHASLSGSMKK